MVQKIELVAEVATQTKALYLFDNSQTHYKRITSLRRSGARGEQNIILNTPLPEWSKEIISNIIQSN